MAVDAADEIAYADQLASDRAVWDSHWEEVRRFQATMAGNFTSTATPGEKLGREVLDNTGEGASDMLVATLDTNLTGPGRFFGYATDDEGTNRDDACARYLEGASEIAFKIFQSPLGNFRSQNCEAYTDLVDFGTDGIMCRDMGARGALFSARPLNELYLAENSEGRVDTVYRRYQLTARQAVQEWGRDTPEEIGKAAQEPTTKNKKFKFLHGIKPRADGDYRALYGNQMPIASCHISVDTRSVLAESGYPVMPMAVARWRTKPGEVYGRGCGMKALADVKMLQRTMRVTIRGAEQVADPTLIMPDDGVMGRIKYGPRKIITVRADMMTGQSLPIKVLNTGAQPQVSENLAEGIRHRIEAAYHYNLINVLRDPQMTATQVIELAQQVRQLMGLIIGRLETEKLDTLVHWAYDFCRRTGAFDILGPVPDKLKSRKRIIIYQSPLAKAARSGEVQNILRTLEYAVNLSQYDPEAVDYFDVTKALLRIADILGFPKELMRTDDQVKVIRQQRAQQKQQQVQLDAAERLATAGAKVMGAQAGLASSSAAEVPAAA